MPKHRDKLPEFEAPKKKLLTEHDQCVKALFQIQTNVSTNLKSELQKQMGFEKGTESFIFSSNVAGTSSLKQLKDDENQQGEINELLKYGLTESDVKLYHEFNAKGLEHIQKKYSSHEPELLKNKIDALLENINNRKKCHAEVHRGATKWYPTHPMDNIKILKSTLEETVDASTNQHAPDINHIRRKARKVANRLQKTISAKSSNIDTLPSINSNSKTLWDKTEPGDTNPPEQLSTKRTSTQYTCEKQTFYTIKDGEIIKINDEESIFQVTGQLSLEEIKQLPQFLNYQPGNPTNVIYVKNLPKKTSIDDLKIYFKDFPAQEYKVMGGKMRGQAFITFDSVETATKILSTSNGLIINEKPVVLQFGRDIKIK